MQELRTDRAVIGSGTAAFATAIRTHTWTHRRPWSCTGGLPQPTPAALASYFVAGLPRPSPYWKVRYGAHRIELLS
jgi:hypothetical protein